MTDLPPCPHPGDPSHAGLGKRWCDAGREGALTLRNGDTLVITAGGAHVEPAPLGSWNRCQVIVPSGQDAPRTWRCWYPLPCPHHPYKVEARVAATMRVHRSILDP